MAVINRLEQLRRTKSVASKKDPERVRVKDLEVVAKAVFDEVKDFADVRFKDMEVEATRRVASSFDKEMDTRVDHVRGEVKSLIGEFRSEVKSLVDDAVTKMLGQVRDELSKQLEGVAKLCLDSVHKTVAAMPKQQTPTVNVTVPTDAIRIEQGPVTVPTDAIRVTVAEPVVNVNVPRQERPVVNVNVPKAEFKLPELAAPTVNVNVPKARRLKKSIQYDAHGRPVEIEEQEMD
jgi:hypothetical protein